MNLHYRPVADKNAIEVCTALVRFPQPVDAPTFDAIRAEAAVLADKNDLPAQQQITLPQVLLNLGLPISAPPGASFQRFAKDGRVEAELRCEPNAITLVVRRYDSWTDFLQLIENTLLKLLPLYLSSLPIIHSVSLQYDDSFRGGKPSHAAPAGELFRPGSKWITIRDPNTVQQWHSHNGIFIAKNDSRELVNVNVTVNDTAGTDVERNVGLTILVGEFFDIPDKTPLVLEQSTGADLIKTLFVGLHDRHRLILDEVLADDYLSAIGASRNPK